MIVVTCMSGDDADPNWSLVTEQFLAAPHLEPAEAAIQLFDLALSYETGMAVVVDEDVSRALSLLEYAAEFYNIDALAKLSFMHKDSAHGKDKNLRKSFDYLSRAASQGRFRVIVCLCTLPHHRQPVQPLCRPKRRREQTLLGCLFDRMSYRLCFWSSNSSSSFVAKEIL